jgi:hypothetical protein
MKKVVALLVIFVCVGASLFALDLSAGLGGTFSAHSSVMSWTSDGLDALDAAKMDKDMMDSDIVGGAVFAYFDATYVALSLGLGFWGDTVPRNSDAKKAREDAKTTTSLTTFNIGIIGKYPIDLGGFTLFPLLGIDFRLAVDYTTTVDGEKYTYGSDEFKAYDKDGNEYSLSDLATTVLFKFGVGADIPLTDKIYLRPIITYGFSTLSKAEQDSQDQMNEEKNMGSAINSGLDISLAVGFKF